jgi:hypothetical protein
MFELWISFNFLEKVLMKNSKQNFFEFFVFVIVIIKNIYDFYYYSNEFY